MEARRRGVEADVPRELAASERGGDLVGMLIEQSAPRQLVEKCMRSHGTKIDYWGMIPYADDPIQ
jgi:hypothetical protein